MAALREPVALGPTRTWTLKRPLLLLAVVVEIALDAESIMHALLAPDLIAIPGGTIRLLVMGALGVLGLSDRARWARIVFAAGLFATALGGLVFAFFSVPGGRLRFEPVPLAIFLVYSLLGIASLSERRLRRR